jgi:probable addiction module antidote protein
MRTGGFLSEQDGCWVNAMKKKVISGKFQDYLVEKLLSKKEAKAFLDVAMLEFEEDGDIEAFLLALRYLAEANGGISQLSGKSSLNRQNLYKILTGKTVPKFDTTLSIMNSLGYRFKVEALPTA